MAEHRFRKAGVMGSTPIFGLERSSPPTDPWAGCFVGRGLALSRPRNGVNRPTRRFTELRPRVVRPTTDSDKEQSRIDPGAVLIDEAGVWIDEEGVWIDQGGLISLRRLFSSILGLS